MARLPIRLNSPIYPLWVATTAFLALLSCTQNLYVAFN